MRKRTDRKKSFKEKRTKRKKREEVNTLNEIGIVPGALESRKKSKFKFWKIVSNLPFKVSHPIYKIGRTPSEKKFS